MDKKKIYVGNGKKNEKYEIINFSLCLDNIPAEHVFTGKNGKKYIKLTISQNYQGTVDRFGNTHNVVVNTFKPDISYKPKIQKTTQIEVQQFEDDLPF